MRGITNNLLKHFVEDTEDTAQCSHELVSAFFVLKNKTADQVYQSMITNRIEFSAVAKRMTKIVILFFQF